MNEIKNRVAENKNLVTFDLEEFYPKGERILFDIKDWLMEGLLLRERDFRKYVAEYDWNQYQDKYIVFTCSTEAIIPGWAYLLLTTAASPYAKDIAIGSLENLESQLYTKIIEQIDVTAYQDKFVIIKGCSKKPVPESAYIASIQKLQPIAKSLMYGEACSSVPLFKRK